MGLVNAVDRVAAGRELVHAVDARVELQPGEGEQPFLFGGDNRERLALALDVVDRRKGERDLVRHYLDELKRRGIEDAPDFDEAMRQHAAFLIEGYCLVLTNDPVFQPEAPITAYAARFSEAMLDNDTAGVLAAVA